MRQPTPSSLWIAVCSCFGCSIPLPVRPALGGVPATGGSEAFNVRVAAATPYLLSADVSLPVAPRWRVEGSGAFYPGVGFVGAAGTRFTPRRAPTADGSWDLEAGVGGGQTLRFTLSTTDVAAEPVGFVGAYVGGGAGWGADRPVGVYTRARVQASSDFVGNAAGFGQAVVGLQIQSPGVLSAAVGVGVWGIVYGGAATGGPLVEVSLAIHPGASTPAAREPRASAE